MKIFLNKNWSEQFVYSDKTPGIFVGREQEIRNLKNIIINNDSSAILVSSVRGVGKTSFVHKALSEIKDQITPFFVNIGHTLAIKDIEKDKKKILVSIIRHAYLANPKDSEIKELYFDCIGKTTTETSELESNESIDESSISTEIKPKTDNLFAYFGVFLIGVGVSSSIDSILRIIIGAIGLFTITFSAYWKSVTKLLRKTEVNNRNVIDDSTDYLEIKFEKWLRSTAEKTNKKIVFVIDELDKIDVKIAFDYIKEYKNLFTRSSGHFIFISSQEAFDLSNNSRELSIEDGGIFPTFFTHVYYLPLPTATDLRDYLHSIIISSNVEETILINYLLFISGLDFFELKRNINNFILVDEVGQPYLDPSLLEENDVFYNRKGELFGWVDEWFISKNLSLLKNNWKKNSEFQKFVLNFLNDKYPKNIETKELKGDLVRLMEFLVSIGHYTLRNYNIADVDGVEQDLQALTEAEQYIYYCTNTYNRTSLEAPLTKEDMLFVETFKELVRQANDLDNIQEVYETTSNFTELPYITEGRDGRSLTGIDLFITYNSYKDLMDKVVEQKDRITITTEKIVNADKIIKEQINNVKAKYFEVLVNLLNITKDSKTVGSFNIDSSEYSVDTVFKVIPTFEETITSAYSTAVWYRPEVGKYVLLINNFKDEDYIIQGLEVLRNNKNILAINVVTHSQIDIKHKHPLVYKNAIGRRSKALQVTNFVNLKVNDVREIVDILKLIDKFLNS